MNVATIKLCIIEAVLQNDIGDIRHYTQVLDNHLRPLSETNSYQVQPSDLAPNSTYIKLDEELIGAFRSMIRKFAN